MNKIVNNFKPYITFFSWIISVVAFLFMLFGIYYKVTEDLKEIQKTTFRNTIWNNNVPLHDRLETCDIYIALGYNSETKKYCTYLLDTEEYDIIK